MPLNLPETASGSIVTPDSGYGALFFDDNGVLSKKDDAGATTPIGSGSTPGGAAGGSLSGTFPNPAIASDVNLPGNPTAATQSAGNNSTRLANTAFVQAAIAALVGTAPGVLDTLGEIADAINDDANLYTTLVAALALKANLSGATFSGPVNVPEAAYNASTWNGSTEVPTKNAVRDQFEAIAAGAPASHATSHQNGGGDSIKLDDLAAPDDNTDLNANSSNHGLLKKLGSAGKRLKSDGTNQQWVDDEAGLPYVIDGGGAVVTTGEKAGYLRVPFDGLIVGWTLLGDPAHTGSIVVDSWIDTYANFPPTVADTIWGGSKPTLSGADKAEATGLSIAVTKGQLIRHKVDSASTLREATLNYHLTRS